MQANCENVGLIIHARPTKVSKNAILATHTIQVVCLQMLLLQGLAPLHLAVEFGQKDTLRTLLHHRADINAPNSKVRNPSQQAMTFVPCMQILRVQYAHLQQKLQPYLDSIVRHTLPIASTKP